MIITTWRSRGIDPIILTKTILRYLQILNLISESGVTFCKAFLGREWERRKYKATDMGLEFILVNLMR